MTPGRKKFLSVAFQRVLHGNHNERSAPQNNLYAGAVLVVRELDARRAAGRRPFARVEQIPAARSCTDRVGVCREIEHGKTPVGTCLGRYRYRRGSANRRPMRIRRRTNRLIVPSYGRPRYRTPTVRQHDTAEGGADPRCCNNEPCIADPKAQSPLRLPSAHRTSSSEIISCPPRPCSRNAALTDDGNDKNVR